MNKKLKSLISIALLCLVQSGHAEDFRIEFAWAADMEECFATHSPEIKLFNVPAGTTKLKISMIDEDNPYNHGGGKMKYNGEASIPAGTLKSWKGPCPPSQHTYTFIVKTKGGKKVKAKFSQKYPQ